MIARELRTNCEWIIFNIHRHVIETDEYFFFIIGLYV